MPEGRMGNGGVAPYVIIFGTRWNRAVTVTPWPFYAEGYGLQYPLDRWLGGSQGGSGQF